MSATEGDRSGPGALLRRAVGGRRGRRRAVAAIIALALSFVPMVGTLGYFGAFVLTPVLAVFGVAVGIEAGEDETAPASSIVLDALRESAVVLAVVVAMMFLAIAWNPTCDPTAGLLYFGLGPLVSVVLGAVAGLWGSRLGRTRLSRWLFGLAPMFGCTLLGLSRLYFDPVVYAFDPFFGWFSGPIYDESVGVDSRYWWFRTYNLLAAGAALLVWRATRDGLRGSLRTQRREWLGATILAAGAASFGLRPTEHGFHSTVESIGEALGAEIVTEHFVIHYAPRSSTALDIESVAMEHEFAWSRIEAIVGDAPDTPVHSFVFPSSKKKRRLFGAGDVEVSTPWRGQIYLTQRGYPHAVLHHELAHTFAGVWGDPLLRVSRSGLSLDGGMIEGVAVALAPSTSDGLDPHEQAAVLDALDQRPALERVMGPGFWGLSASRAYVTAGSFCLWLLQTHGADKLGAIYRDPGSFESVYGADLGALETQWLAFIRDEVGADPEDVEAQRQRFKRRAVFRRPCAHRAASLGSLASAARRRGDDDGAIAHLQELCTIEPKEPSHRLTLARTRAAAGDLAGALREIDQAAGMKDLTDSILASIDQTRGDVHMVEGDVTAARAAYEQALGRSLRERTRRVVQVKQLGTSDPETAALMGRYFAPFEAEAPDWVVRVRGLTVALAIAERPSTATIGHYLAMRQLTSASLIEDALEHAVLATEDATTPLPTVELKRAAWKGVIALAIRTGRTARARRALDRLRRVEGKHPTRGRRLELERWEGRIDHAESWQDRRR